MWYDVNPDSKRNPHTNPGFSASEKTNPPESSAWSYLNTKNQLKVLTGLDWMGQQSAIFG